MKQSYMNCYFWSILLLGLSGCTTFKGPGEFRPLQPTARETAPMPLLPETEEAEAGELFFLWPLENHRKTRGFFVNGNKRHLGLDLAAPRGTPILAAQSGKVIYAGRSFRGYGNLIIIEHENEFASLYSHLHSFKVKEGQKVDQGQIIGTVGNTGNARGVHLHFELRLNKRPVDPEVFLPGSIKQVDR